MSDPYLFTQLSHEWRRTAASPAARAVAARWASCSPALASFATPAAVVERCHDRAAGEEAQSVLRALLQLAADPWAARAFLQAVMPGLVAISNRYRDLSFPSCPSHRAVWQNVSELDQQVAATAYEVIHECAGRHHPWPANRVVVTTRLRIRRHAAAELRRRSRLAPDCDPASVALAAPPARTPAEELVVALVEAVERGSITPLDAGLIYRTRIEGDRIEDLAPALGHNWRWGYRHRARAESVLLTEAFGCDPRDETELAVATS